VRTDAGKAVQDRVDRHHAQFERRCLETPQVRLDAVRQLARAALLLLSRHIAAGGRELGQFGRGDTDLADLRHEAVDDVAAHA